MIWYSQWVKSRGQLEDVVVWYKTKRVRIKREPFDARSIFVSAPDEGASRSHVRRLRVPPTVIERRPRPL